MFKTMASHVAAGLMLSGSSLSAFAADDVGIGAASIRDAAIAANAQAVQQTMATAARNHARADQLKNQGASTLSASVAGGNKPADLFANPYYAYPPSCLSDGLPFRAFPQSTSDPQPFQSSLTLPGDPAQCFQGGNTTECNYTESVTATVWRVACSGGKSATLMEIDRPAAKDGSTATYPTFPVVAVTQGSKSLFIRLADDPNTFLTTTFPNSPLVNSDVWVLENFYAGPIQFDYNQAFTLTLDNTIQFSLPVYDKNQYAAASQPLPISGYMSTNWTNPTQDGEGMLIQVFDSGDHATRVFTFAWFTYDNNHRPFWLFGQGGLNIGDSQVTATTVYPTGGSFAGTINGVVTSNPWGTATFSFPDCGTMNVTYNGSAAAAQGPTSIGTQTKTFKRLADINSLSCQQ